MSMRNTRNHEVSLRRVVIKMNAGCTMREMNGHTEAIWSEKIVNAHLAKDGVLAIEVGLLCVGDEELGFVGVGARVGHS